MLFEHLPALQRSSIDSIGDILDIDVQLRRIRTEERFPGLLELPSIALHIVVKVLEVWVMG